MTWTVQKFLQSYRNNQSNQHHQSNQHTAEESDNQSISAEEESECDNQSISSENVRKRMSHENLNQHLRNWKYTTNNNDNDNDNQSISSFSSRSIMTTENLKKHYSTRNSDIVVIQKAFKAKNDEVKRLRNEKETIFINLSREIKVLKAKLEKETNEKQALLRHIEKQKCSTAIKANGISQRKEIYWDLNFLNKSKSSFNSDNFSFLDHTWRLCFMKTNMETYGFFIELTNCSSDSDKEIPLRALFKMHHSFANPYMKSKSQPLICSAMNNKRGIMQFVSFDNVEYFIQDNNILKLSVVLELA